MLKHLVRPSTTLAEPGVVMRLNTKVNGKSTIAEDNEKAPLILETFEMIAKGSRSIEEVRIIMESRGLRLANGSPVGKSYLHKLIRNKLYAGIIEKFNETHRGAFNPIVPEELFLAVQDILRGKGRKEVQYKKDNDDFPLRRFVFNDEGKKLTGSFSKGRQGVRYPFYRFGSKGSNYKRDKFDELFKEFMDQYSFSEEQKEKLKQKITSKFSVTVEKEEKSIKKLESRITELEKQQNTLVEKNIKGVISDELLARQLSILENSLNECKVNLITKSVPSLDIDRAMRVISPYLDKPSTPWSKATIDNKLKLQWFQFPSGVFFNGEKFGTAKIASIFNVKSAFLDADSTSVDPSGFEPLTSGVQNQCSTK